MILEPAEMLLTQAYLVMWLSESFPFLSLLPTYPQGLYILLKVLQHIVSLLPHHHLTKYVTVFYLLLYFSRLQTLTDAAVS